MGIEPVDTNDKVIEARLKLSKKLFNWCLSNSRRTLKAKDQEKTIRWALLAARSGDLFGCGQLSSPELEAQILRIAEDVPTKPFSKVNRPAKAKRWLHILSGVANVGGHTRLVTRWIELGRDSDQHSVVLTFQNECNVNPLSKAVNSSGGKIITLGSLESLLERAIKLRELAWNGADYIVLHTHMWDVVAPIALGIEGGPPVLFVNHADHVFWVGASVTDLVLNIRKKAEHLTKHYRGIERNYQLPIPLTKPPELLGSINARRSIRKMVRSVLHIPIEAPVLITIGSPFKYNPILGLNFLSVAKEILQKCQDAYLIAIGPEMKDPDWGAAHETTQGRIIALGSQQDLVKYHLAADLYLEGFPFGSVTALLEAGLAGLAPIRAPRTCPLQFRSDGIALDSIGSPVDTADYIWKAVEFVNNREKRVQFGLRFAERVENYHCGDNWKEQLRRLMTQLPVRHKIYHIPEVPLLPRRIEKFWSAFLARSNPKDPAGTIYRYASSLGLNPILDFSILWHAIRVTKCRQGLGVLKACGIFDMIFKQRSKEKVNFFT